MVAPSKPSAAFALALRAQLFSELGGVDLNTYAVLDGAAIPDLLDHLYAAPRPDFVCLYRGALAPDIAYVAPYLVRLQPAAPFTDWLLSEGWGRHWGVFAVSTAGLAAVRKHFRTFLIVRNPAGKQVYFRYYDPRILRLYLPTCTAEETRFLFGPLLAYLCEGEQPDTLLSFSLEAGLPRCTTIQTSDSK